MPTLFGVIAAVGVLVAILGSLGGMFFWIGHHAARIESLEAWRKSVRYDMHEISEKITYVGEELKRLSTLIEERTDRRAQERSFSHSHSAMTDAPLRP